MEIQLIDQSLWSVLQAYGTAEGVTLQQFGKHGCVEVFLHWRQWARLCELMPPEYGRMHKDCAKALAVSHGEPGRCIQEGALCQPSTNNTSA